MSNETSERNSLILVDHPAKGVLQLTLNRPDKLNAQSKPLLAELARHLSVAQGSPKVGCVILTGAGRAFSAGADINDMLTHGVNSYTDPGRLATWDEIQSFPKPMIAALNGFTFGGGLELALLCDIIIAAESAKLGTPEIKLGSFPGDGGTQRLPRLVGKSFAMQMILTGEPISAGLAERKGLVSEVLPDELLLVRAVEIGRQIAEKSVAVTPYAKAAVNAAFDMPLAAGLNHEHRLTAAAFMLNDRQEGLKAFVEKRPAEFSGN